MKPRKLFHLLTASAAAIRTTPAGRLTRRHRQLWPIQCHSNPISERRLDDTKSCSTNPKPVFTKFRTPSIVGNDRNA